MKKSKAYLASNCLVMHDKKLEFLLNEYPSILRKIDPNTKPHWGKMNLQQMIEHMIDSVREANGKTPRSVITPQENIPRMKEFLMSEKEFRPNTKNSLMGEEPMPVRISSVDKAIDELENELKNFVNHYKNTPDRIVANPFFGELDYEEWSQLLYKHSIHHLRQFGFTAVY